MKQTKAGIYGPESVRGLNMTGPKVEQVVRSRNKGAPQSISLLLTYDLENWTPGGWAHYLEGTYVHYGLFVTSRSLS